MIDLGNQFFCRTPWLRSQAPRKTRSRPTKGSCVDYKLELIAVPVSDVDRAKTFYADQVGFHADHDHRVNENLRFVQLTPPGSGCSIAIGEGIVDSEPGSVRGLQLVVPDIEIAHAELSGRGVAVSDIEDLSWGSFIYFADPDGNAWAIQQSPGRL